WCPARHRVERHLPFRPVGGPRTSPRPHSNIHRRNISMRPVSRFACLCLALSVLTGAPAAFSQTAVPAPTPTPASAPGSTEERIRRLEKLLAETRAEVAALKAAPGAANDAKLAEIERRIDILAQEIEAMKIGEAAQGAAPDQPAQAAAGAAPPSESPFKP